MNTKEFKEQILDFKKHIFDRLPILPPSVKKDIIYQDIIKLKKLTSRIDFGCNFDSDGKCETRRSIWKGSPACCCVKCKIHLGYINFMIQTDIPKYAKHFSLETGFWRKGVGCLLSRELRSAICVSHACDDPDDVLDGLQDVLHHMEGKLIRKY